MLVKRDSHDVSAVAVYREDAIQATFYSRSQSEQGTGYGLEVPVSGHIDRMKELVDVLQCLLLTFKCTIQYCGCG